MGLQRKLRPGDILHIGDCTIRVIHSRREETFLDITAPRTMPIRHVPGPQAPEAAPPPSRLDKTHPDSNNAPNTSAKDGP